MNYDELMQEVERLKLNRRFSYKYTNEELKFIIDARNDGTEWKMIAEALNLP